MAKNYNSSENCHNEADKNTSNRNASRNVTNFQKQETGWRTGRFYM